ALRNRHRAGTTVQDTQHEDLFVEVDGDDVPCTLFRAGDGEPGTPVLVLHDYGGSRKDVAGIAAFLASTGHDALTIDLDGHADNPRAIADAAMERLLSSACDLLAGETSRDGLVATGVGLGGLLAMQLASTGAATRAVAIDPPARDEEGFHDVSALREYSIGGVLAESFRPSARREGGKRISFSRLIASLPAVPCDAEGAGRITIVGSRGPWLNYERGLAEFAHLCSPFEPVFLKGTHESLPLQSDTLEILSGVLS
ncbi:MAG: dienelactone hydrolase family protein, partial [Candidatus Geothermincolia bacterium]